jgi:transcriptional regulator with XRE-family HTH domain
MCYERIRELREDKDMAQKEIAQLLDMNRRTYSSYETGVRTMSPDILIRLACFHGVSVDYMLGLTDIRKPYPKK